MEINRNTIAKDNQKSAISTSLEADLRSSGNANSAGLLVFVPAIKGCGQQHQDDPETNYGKYEIKSEHMIKYYDFNVVIQRLIDQNNMATIAPPIRKEISNRSKMTGKTIEAIKTVPKSALISESLERNSLPGSCMFIFSIADVRNLSIDLTAGAFLNVGGFGARE